MLDIILHKHFILVQLGMFSISFSLALSNKGRVTTYNNSLFYKMTITFLLLFSFIITFIEFKWWSSILYFIASFLIESTFATFIINQIIPNEYFEPTQLKIRPSISDKFWSYLILLNYLLLNILLVFSIYVIFFQNTNKNENKVAIDTIVPDETAYIIDNVVDTSIIDIDSVATINHKDNYSNEEDKKFDELVKTFEHAANPNVQHEESVVQKAGRTSKSFADIFKQAQNVENPNVQHKESAVQKAGSIIGEGNAEQNKKAHEGAVKDFFKNLNIPTKSQKKEDEK